LIPSRSRSARSSNRIQSLIDCPVSSAARWYASFSRYVHLKVAESSLFGRFDLGLAMHQFKQHCQNAATCAKECSHDVDTLFSFCSRGSSTRDGLLTGLFHCSKIELIRSFRIFYPFGRLSALKRVFLCLKLKKPPSLVTERLTESGASLLML
jgi:hypothetical protein